MITGSRHFRPELRMRILIYFLLAWNLGYNWSFDACGKHVLIRASCFYAHVEHTIGFVKLCGNIPLL